MGFSTERIGASRAGCGKKIERALEKENRDRETSLENERNFGGEWNWGNGLGNLVEKLGNGLGQGTVVTKKTDLVKGRGNRTRERRLESGSRNGL
jgi:hypothetical protein